MKKIILVLCLPFIFASCEIADLLDDDNFNNYGQNIIFELENNTGYQITDIEIFITNDSTISDSVGTIENEEKKEIILDMCTAEVVDGSYSITYKLSNEINNKTFGYYTNGYPLEEKIKIYISKTGLTIN